MRRYWFFNFYFECFWVDGYLPFFENSQKVASMGYLKLLVADDDSFFAVEKLIEHLLVPSMPSLVVEPFEFQNNLRARVDNYDADIS